MKIRLALFLTLFFSDVIDRPVVRGRRAFRAGHRQREISGTAEAPLKEPINDARDVADELKRDGFTVDIGENLTGDGMRRAFERLYGKIKPGSVALIFFSGFGVQSNRQSYMIPVDAQIWTEADIRRDGFQVWKPYWVTSTAAAPASRSPCSMPPGATRSSAGSAAFRQALPRSSRRTARW